MPKRTIDTELWCHPDFQKLPSPAKLLYIYLWSNCHCTASGLYRISLSTIGFETGLPEINGALKQLEPLDVTWNEPTETMWVKKFLKHQAHSPQFLQAVAKALELVSDKTLVRRYLEYNNTLSIPYEYPTDTIPISETVIETGKESVSDKSQSKVVDKEFIDSLRGRFPGVDIDNEWNDCLTWWREHRKKMKAPQSALLNWLKGIKDKGVNNGNRERVPQRYTTPEESRQHLLRASGETQETV